MARQLFGAKPLSELSNIDFLSTKHLVTDLKEIQSKYNDFLSRKCILKCCLQNVSHFQAAMC